jgi:hypothetical protein
MPAFELGWDTFSCRCRSHLHRARTPLVILPSCSAPRSTGRRVATVVPAVAMAVASTRARTRLRSPPRARAPTHVHAFSREGGRPDLFIPLSLDRSRARRRSAAASRGAAFLGTLPPGWREHRVVPELAHPLSCLHARTVTGRGYPSRPAEPLSVSPLRRLAPTLALATCFCSHAFEHARAPLCTVRMRAYRRCSALPSLDPRRARGQCLCVDPPSCWPWPQPHHEGHPLLGRSFRALADQ